MINMAFNPVNTLFCNVFILLTDKSLDMNKLAIDMSLDKGIAIHSLSVNKK